MKKSEIPEMPQYFDRYINLVDDIDVVAALEAHGEFAEPVEATSIAALADRRYADEKWTVKEVIQHVTDNERIFCNRAIRFARMDNTPLPGYDENQYGQVMDLRERNIAHILEEFKAVRRATIMMFQSFNRDELLRSGTGSGISISVLALGFMLVGHQKHHMQVIRERYFPLLEQG